MIDLHTHSCFSDGSDTPAELLKKANEIGLKGLALTDHDSVEGCPSFQEEALKYPNITPINGCEFSVDHPATIEILALNITDLAPYKTQQEILKTHRIQACIERIEKLTALGYSIKFEDVAYDEQGILRPLLAKPHIVNFLYQTKQIPDKETGYKKL